MLRAGRAALSASKLVLILLVKIVWLNVGVGSGGGGTPQHWLPLGRRGLAAVERGAWALRVHDVAPHVAALAVLRPVLGSATVPA